LSKAQVGGDERALGLVALVHEVEEQADLHRFDLDIAHLIDEQTIEGEVFLEDFGFGMVGDGAVEFADQVGKEHVAAAVAVVDGVDEETGGQAGFPAARNAHPNEVLVFAHVAQGVVEGQQALFVEFGLALEGIGFDDQRFGDAGVLEPELASILAFAPGFLGQHVGEQVRVGEALLGGQLEVIVPVGQQAAQAQVFQGFNEFRVQGRVRGIRGGLHNGRDWEDRSASLADRFHVRGSSHRPAAGVVGRCLVGGTTGRCARRWASR